MERLKKTVEAMRIARLHRDQNIKKLKEERGQEKKQKYIVILSPI